MGTLRFDKNKQKVVAGKKRRLIVTRTEKDYVVAVSKYAK